MSRIMFSAEERHEEAIKRIKSEENLDSTSAAVRECIDRMIEMQQREEELQQRVDELQQQVERLQQERDERVARLQTDVERLQNEKRQILAQREEHTELVREVRRDRTLAERKAQAGLLTKTKWALFGMRDETDDEGG